MSGNDTNGMPGASAMGDTLEFVKNLWASMKLPGMNMPSLSPEDIDKQIADLKAVESWLQMNMNMLRSTIQALEVQSATLNALRSMGQSFANAANAVHAAATTPADAKPSFDSPFERPASAAASAGEPQAAADPAAGSAGAFPDAAAMAAQFASPAAWWNTVQEQFSNAVGQALTPPKKKAGKRSGPPKAKAEPESEAATRTTARKASPRKRAPKA